MYELYGLAGKPSLRWLANTIRERDDLPGLLSHAAISDTLRGVGGLPGWPRLESLVRILAEKSASQVNIEEAVLRIHGFWLEADEKRPELKSSIDSTLKGVKSRESLLRDYHEATDQFSREYTRILAAVEQMNDWLVFLRAGGIEALIGALASRGLQEEAEFLMFPEEWALEEFWKSGDLLDMELELVLYYGAAWRSPIEIAQAAAALEARDKTSSPLMMTLMMAAFWRSPRDAALLLRCLDSDDHSVLFGMALGVSCRRAVSEIAEIVDALQRMGGGRAFDAICDFIVRRPSELLLPVVKELREIESVVAANNVLFLASRRGAEDVMALLTLLRDEGMHSDAQYFISTCCYRTPKDMCALIDALRSSRRSRAAVDLLAAVLQTGTSRVLNMLMFLRERQRFDDMNHVFAGEVRNECRAELAEALELLGFSDEAKKVSTGGLAPSIDNR
ncbi:hypothetical protein [Streptacidiphilus albus]|uniref:hypothetical protein n=1 Tax=Streptacidiphilus albus TaxID=105425 RepID=UPI00128C6076|nr:hypothetical protein [Streptacidiphilus albus]